MEASSGMVAGSHKRNELVRIRHDSSDSGVSHLNVNYNVVVMLFCIVQSSDRIWLVMDSIDSSFYSNFGVI